MSIPPRVSAAVPGRLSVHRSPKRQRLGESYDSSSSSSDEEEVGIAEAVGVTRTATIANDSTSSSDEEEEEEEEEEVGIAEVAGVTRTAAIVSDSTSSSDEEDDLLIVRIAGVPRTATIANNSGNVTRSVNSTPEASSSSSSPQSVKLKSSDVLDCPTCCEPLKKPIYQCSNGHLACSSCVTKLSNRCPFCRSHIGDIRCRAMEKIIETSVVSCRNSVYGCKEATTYGNQSSSHEKLCAYVPCSCPLSNCDYTGSYEDLKSHARSSHSWDEEDDNRFEFAMDRPLTFRLNLEKEKATTTVFREENEGDLIVVQGFRKPDGVYVTVSCIAPMIPGIRRFSCSLAKLNERTSLRLGLMVKQIQKVGVKEEEPKDGFLLIPSYMLNSGQWKMQICIGSGRKYIHI
uniref:RING-type E3 ubiquitin transferase n=1 Tax=Noccaea caerulescens TaxID=107243 RepID=A0A1J3F335_NOCCA